MTTLIVSPAFASHYQPLAVLGTAARRAGERVVVACAESFRHRVLEDGFEWRELTLSRGHNPGVSRPEDQAPEEAHHLRAFFAATRMGAVATLAFQAERRVDDLLWEPESVARRLDRLIAELAPVRIIGDHVSLTTTAALRGLGVAFESFVPGHPAQLPVAEERYGAPDVWPAALHPGAVEHARLVALCDLVTARVADRFNAAVEAIGAGADPVEDPFRVHGGSVVYNYLEHLHAPERRPDMTFPHRFLNGCIREEALPPDLARAVAGIKRHGLVYVSLGTFLSARDDVLGAIAADLRELGRPVAIATGATPPERLGPLPKEWIVAPVLPQVALLRHASVAVTHGGCNSVVEALSAGVPTLALPFSTDQFAIAADLERTGLGRCLDPNRLSRGSIAALIDELVASRVPAAVG